jgi:hypothetical protein
VMQLDDELLRVSENLLCIQLQLRAIEPSATCEVNSSITICSCISPRKRKVQGKNCSPCLQQGRQEVEKCRALVASR